jgi:hypothetical protein
MRVATFNILHGRTVGDGVHPQRLMDCVRGLNPDVGFMHGQQLPKFDEGLFTRLARRRQCLGEQRLDPLMLG